MPCGNMHICTCSTDVHMCMNIHICFSHPFIHLCAFMLHHVTYVHLNLCNIVIRAMVLPGGQRAFGRWPRVAGTEGPTTGPCAWAGHDGATPGGLVKNGC